ncbi:hypothetical protein JVT61DRAFT_8455 [Boletus reticuloceps]|uniref:Uncharacterized protein n=1 Tax=Boletus reticuloceps TaxID=495285 RepID=A0A8I2YW03_9AGAM|nr:hypothetical protein JVT61DRAFT_8455 [Boletus reticuloceps]
MLPASLLALRKNLVDTGLYLGDKSVLDNVHWIRDGRADRLAVKPASVTSESSTNSGSRGSSSPPDKSPELAPLSAIVHISELDFWLTSDSGYLKPSKIWRELANVKPSCTAEQPDPQPVREDFKTVIKHLREIQSTISKPEFQPGKGFLLGGGISGQRIKVRHTLFEPLGSEAEGDHESADEQEAKDGGAEAESQAVNSDASDFAIENWPLTHEETRAELEELQATHRVVPIPAYNIQGNLIKPNAYQRSLQNALVELHFYLNHWSIAGKQGNPGNDVFTADIHLIRVIAPPRSSAVVTPRKRKISLFVDPASTPTKRLRRN